MTIRPIKPRETQMLVYRARALDSMLETLDKMIEANDREIEQRYNSMFEDFAPHRDNVDFADMDDEDIVKQYCSWEYERWSDYVNEGNALRELREQIVKKLV